VWYSDARRALVLQKKPDGSYSRIGNGLSPENNPAAPVVTSDGAVWFYESLSWHPRIARLGSNGEFEEFRDPLLDCTIPATEILCSEGIQAPPPVMYADGNSVSLQAKPSDLGISWHLTSIAAGMQGRKTCGDASSRTRAPHASRA
jgi:hypothetical protein